MWKDEVHPSNALRALLTVSLLRMTSASADADGRASGDGEDGGRGRRGNFWLAETPSDDRTN